MDVLKISLEALLQRATNPQNQNIDTAAVDAFCAMINKEKDGPLIGVKLLSVRLHSKHEQEVLQTLHILDYSMQKCGSNFQFEVGKFRFLNEMIKLVSPKYLGSYTPPSIKQKVSQLMYLWTLDYPKETKIKEAYDMLKKQGVINRDLPLSVSADQCNISERKLNTVFQDEEKSKLLKKLLQSKNPDDLQAANRLIKSMVKEDEKKAELKSKRITELESAQNNVRLLTEMLDSYKPDVSSQDEYDLIQELQESCVRMRPNLAKIASETHQNEEMLGEILQMNDEIGLILDKYNDVIIIGNKPHRESQSSQLSLLDLSGAINDLQPLQLNQNPQSNMDAFCDILTAPNIPESLTLSDSDASILKPVHVDQKSVIGTSDTKSNKTNALKELDVLGERLLQENLQCVVDRIGPQFNKPPERVPMNLLPKLTHSDADSNTGDSAFDIGNDFNFDLTTFLNNPKLPSDASADKIDVHTDDLLVDITEEDTQRESIDNKDTEIAEKTELKLSDIFVDLESIKPSHVNPITALEEKNGISVTLHFAKDTPHEDLIVIVVTTASKNVLPLKNVLFRAIVPKSCKVKLQAPSAADLPAFNPFLPPAAITQVLLIANPEKVQVSLKFIVSYNIEDETMTEMGEIDCLPTVV